MKPRTSQSSTRLRDRRSTRTRRRSRVSRAVHTASISPSGSRRPRLYRRLAPVLRRPPTRVRPPAQLAHPRRSVRARPAHQPELGRPRLASAEGQHGRVLLPGQSASLMNTAGLIYMYTSQHCGIYLHVCKRYVDQTSVGRMLRPLQRFFRSASLSKCADECHVLFAWVPVPMFMQCPYSLPVVVLLTQHDLVTDSYCCSTMIKKRSQIFKA